MTMRPGQAASGGLPAPSSAASSSARTAGVSRPAATSTTAKSLRMIGTAAPSSLKTVAVVSPTEAGSLVRRHRNRENVIGRPPRRDDR
jgi:hypothetical protein